MKNEHAELLKLQTSAEEEQNRETSSNKNTELLHRERVEGSPFYIVGNKETGYFLTFGKYRLTDPKESIVKVREELYNEMWDIVTKLCITIIEEVDFKAIREADSNKLFKEGINVNK